MGGLRWEEKRQRWIAEITIGYDGRGKRIAEGLKADQDRGQEQAAVHASRAGR
jgi:hypothetical protein